MDPHVVALIYRLVPAPGVDYDEAPSATFDTHDFQVLVAGDKARFEMKAHHPTRQSAEAVVAPFITAWQIDIGLATAPGELRFVFENAEIIDRQPAPPGAAAERARRGMVSFIELEVPSRIRRRSYPPPPQNFVATPDVLSMYHRYELYRQGKEPLASMAYFCLTVLEGTVGRGPAPRRRAASEYSIHKRLLDKLGDLTANKGGNEARKAEGAGTEFTEAEREWIEAAVVKLIQRLGEHAAGHAQLRLLSLADLPALA